MEDSALPPPPPKVTLRGLTLFGGTFSAPRSDVTLDRVQVVLPLPQLHHVVMPLPGWLHHVLIPLPRLRSVLMIPRLSGRCASRPPTGACSTRRETRRRQRPSSSTRRAARYPPPTAPSSGGTPSAPLTGSVSRRRSSIATSSGLVTRHVLKVAASAQMPPEAHETASEGLLLSTLWRRGPS